MLNLVEEAAKDGTLPLSAITTLNTARKNGVQILELLNNISDLSKLVSSSMELMERPSSLKPILQAALELSRKEASVKGVSVHLEVPSKLAASWFVCDSVRCQQLLLNLMNTASKLTSNSSITLSVTMDDGTLFSGRSSVRSWSAASTPTAAASRNNSPTCQCVRKLLRFEVLDLGVNIEPRDFNSFGLSAQSPRLAGCGFGLAMCKQLCDRLGGTIGARNSLEKGASIWVALPLRHCQFSCSDLSHHPFVLSTTTSPMFRKDSGLFSSSPTGSPRNAVRLPRAFSDAVLESPNYYL
eukprot:GILI01020629.1.p1 GENE.GILI01020629.1~~GILI01020629.1.p1  ORF type:complete len:333 (+),score=97.09 GILI01020629.1:109-999(+)